jgi:predicted TIM-barrel fold metal-dependent hydrolase
MIIDAHAHAAGDYATAESIITTIKKYRIDKVVLCTSPKNNIDLEAPPNFPFLKSPNSIYLLNRMLRLGYKSFKDHGNGNQYVFGLKNKLPEVVIQFLWVNPLNRSHMDNIERNIENYKVSGIKLHQAWDSFAIDGDEFNELTEVACAHKLPVFIHLYSKKETRKLLGYAKKNQKVTFIVAHMLGLDIFKEERQSLSNMYFDTSGSERVRGRDILQAIRLFGGDHVVFGSDTPYERIEDQIDKIDRLELTDQVKELIFEKNIRSVLSLSD